jgi:hypothetical protein
MPSPPPAGRQFVVVLLGVLAVFSYAAGSLMWGAESLKKVTSGGPGASAGNQRSFRVFAGVAMLFGLGCSALAAWWYWRPLSRREMAVRDGRDLAMILEAVKILLAKPGNEFASSAWSGPDAAAQELDGWIVQFRRGKIPERAPMAGLFAATGPVHEVAMRSGWARELRKLGQGFDEVAERIWPPEKK